MSDHSDTGSSTPTLEAPPSLSDFQACVGGEVRIDDDCGNQAKAVLRIAEPVTGHGDDGAEFFSVVFELPGPRAPLQGTYSFTLPNGRTQALFATPVACPNTGFFWLESVINFHPEPENSSQPSH